MLYYNIVTVSAKKSLEPRYNKIESIHIYQYFVLIVLDGEMCHAFIWSAKYYTTHYTCTMYLYDTYRKYFSGSSNGVIQKYKLNRVSSEITTWVV